MVEDSIAKKFFWSKGFIYLSLTFVLFISFALVKEYQRQGKVNEKVDELKQEVADLEGSNNELASLVEYLNSDEYVELEARKSLGLRKPGEGVIVIKGREVQILGENDERNVSNPKKWLDYFFRTI